MNTSIRTLRELNLIGNPKQKTSTERDARILLIYLMMNVPSSTVERMMEIMGEFSDSPEHNFMKFMKGLK